jgi:hypothetical protein
LQSKGHLNLVATGCQLINIPDGSCCRVFRAQPIGGFA